MSNAIEYTVLFTLKHQGKTTSEFTGSVSTISEAMKDARQNYDSGHRLLGLHQIDLITGDIHRIHTGEHLRALFDAEDESEHFELNATDADMDYFVATGCMNVADEVRL